MFVTLLLDGTQESVDKLNWNLNNGYKVVDRFDGGSWIVVMLEKAN